MSPENVRKADTQSERPPTTQELLDRVPEVSHTGSYKEREILRPTDGYIPRRSNQNQQTVEEES